MNQADFFEKYGYVYIKNIFTQEQCLRFAALMLAMKEENMLTYEGKTNENPNAFFGKSFGRGTIPQFEQALRDIQPRIENELNLVGKIKPSNSFARIYYNGGTLDEHVDREGLDYTLSITLLNNLNKDWPLWAIDNYGNTVPLNIEMGDGGMMLGRKIKHWRDPLVCNEDEYIVQLFLHWTAI